MIVEDALVHPGIRHAFHGREGGVSQGLYGSLNCGPGSADDPAAVAENRARAVSALGLAADSLRTLHQVHSSRVVVLDDPAQPAGQEADALVTRRPGVTLGILTADCAPVLFADPEAGVIGAAHAGWKGAIGGVVAATVAAMVGLGARPERMVAAIGPCIAQPSYEVDLAFVDRFLAQDAANCAFFTAGRPGRALFDLPGYVAGRLSAAGIGRVVAAPPDTYADPARFFSYRRSCHRQEGDYGRQVAVIALAS